jgi:hypothetical protein
MCVRGFEMVKGLDYEENFSPTPGISIARLMVSIVAANDQELHSVDIEQDFVQTDKLKEGANGRYFVTPPLLMDYHCMVIHRRHELYTKRWTLILEVKDSILSGSKSQFDEDQLVENMPKIFLFRLTWMIALFLVNLQIIWQ